MTVAGTISDFDESAFRASLASQIDGVSPDDILLEVAAASVAVTATIIPTSNTTADSVLSTLSAFDASTLSAALNVTVESLDPPVSSMQVFGPATPPPYPPPLLSHTNHSFLASMVIVLRSLRHS